MSSGVLPIDIAYVFGLLVVVPMGVWLLGGRSGGAIGAAVLGGIGAAGLFLVPTDFHGYFLLFPWFVFVLALAGTEAIRFIKGWKEPDRLVRGIRLLASLFLVVSAMSVAALRGGREPFGFPALVVALTAVHYLFTGFGAVLFCWKATSWSAIRSRRMALLGSACVVVGTPVIAAGITLRQISGVEVFSVGETLGASILAVGLVLVAWQVFRGVSAAGTSIPTASRVLLRIPMVVAPFSMGLAVIYGTHRWLGTPALTEPRMAETHGMLNALGFVACGLAGWISLERRRPE